MAKKLMNRPLWSKAGRDGEFIAVNPSAILSDEDGERTERSYSLALEGTICLLQHFINSGSSHSAADAHRHDAAFGFPALQLMKQLSGQFGACAA